MNTPSRILLVDGDDNFLHLFSLMLMELGWPAAAASQAGDALNMVKAESYHVAFVNNQIGTMEGIDLIEKIQEVDPDLPCILMSSNLCIDATVHALKKGVAGFMRKPFHIEDLLVSIEYGNKTRKLMQRAKEMLSELKRCETEKGDEPVDA